MTPQTRSQLLHLIDALCDGRANAEQIAQLERLVIEDPEARRLYVQAISLHGMLHWDAAGAGEASPIRTMPPEPVSGKARISRARWGALAAAAVLLVTALVFLIPGDAPQQVVDHDPNQPAENTSAPSRSPADETMIAENRLPRNDAPGIPRDESTQMADTRETPRVPKVTLPAEPVAPPPRRTDSESRNQDGSIARSDTPALPPVPSLPQKLIGSTDQEIVSFINEQLERSWEDHAVTPAPRASDSEWVRRVHLDLLGRVPTLLEVEAFLNDTREDRRELLVSTLLRTRDHSRHMATVWTNLLVGRAANEDIDRQALFVWMQDQFLQNEPWRNVVTQLVTAEGTANESGPANFLLAHLNNEAVPATAITARILMCEQLQCSQCHQHPLANQWGQERFWEMNAFFQQATVQMQTVTDEQTGRRRRVRELVDTGEFGPTYYESLRGVMQVAFPKYSGKEITEAQEVPLREQLADLLFFEEKPQMARAFVNRTWGQLFGYGFTNPIDDMGPHTPVSNPALLEGLTEAFVNSGYDVRRLVRWICISDAYQRTSRAVDADPLDMPEQGETPLFSRMYVKPLTAEQLYDSLRIAAGVTPVQLGQEPMRLAREEWIRQFYTAIDTEENSDASTFGGTLPQALMMMNGELVEQATDLQEETLFRRIALQNDLSDSEKIRRLSLAALSRYPSSDELSRIRDLLHRHIRQQRADRTVSPQAAQAEGLRDIYWAYLNSSEFAVVR